MMLLGSVDIYGHTAAILVYNEKVFLYIFHEPLRFENVRKVHRFAPKAPRLRGSEGSDSSEVTAHGADGVGDSPVLVWAAAAWVNIVPQLCGATLLGRQPHMYEQYVQSKTTGNARV